MSEPTNAQMAEQEDLRLDAQIAEHQEQQYQKRLRDEMTPPLDEDEPDREPPEEDREAHR